MCGMFSDAPCAAAKDAFDTETSTLSHNATHCSGSRSRCAGAELRCSCALPRAANQ
jgi:hypothetical protein